MYLDEQTFKMIIDSTPLVSIDLLIKNSEGKYLLGYRNNRPAKGFWFVPGGRILKDESIDSAFTRLCKNELMIDIDMQQAHLIGVFDHFYDDCVFGKGVSTHYVVLGYQLDINLDIGALPKEQHNRYAWFSKQAMLNREDVHMHSKWYLEPLSR
ncbi:GDP-mannose mannosyl hydrolase [Shewanella sp. Scap07]|uniref:GDP-mannose mannosyl hydrolase n=1 Tax=Shewanella sp. Scap07 TaxID=2589987 RepID=UPI0015BE946C|nr:GDP-mannose mannosyl hydrolase [Shewanella sp. Scap07]QLE86084.1 GDP-mannose mannosyl hydrolase [Shewanella sp. Scap07]